jgi:hypothetical protein
MAKKGFQFLRRSGWTASKLPRSTMPRLEFTTSKPLRTIMSPLLLESTEASWYALIRRWFSIMYIWPLEPGRASACQSMQSRIETDTEGRSTLKSRNGINLYPLVLLGETER